MLLPAMIVAVAVIASAAWIATSLAEEEGIADLRVVARNRLDLYRNNLVNALDRHKDLALALVRNREVNVLLNDSGNDMRAEEVSRQFRSLVNATGVLAIFLINRQARVISSSNFKDVDSFVGQILDFRKYYKDAIKTGVGRLFAIGTQNGIAGYYIAYSTDERNGVVVIKVGVNELEEAWRHAPERVMVTDRSGIVFLTNFDSWRYKSLTRLDGATVVRVNAELQYNRRKIEPLPLRSVGDDVFAMNDRRFLMETAQLPDSDWTLRVLTATESIRYRTNNAALLAGTGTSLALGVAFFLMQRRRALRDHIALQERTKEDLERQVRARTAELVEASKLAALGQMAAGIVHEINQPVSAIRLYTHSSDVLLSRGVISSVRENLQAITALTGRLASITSQLKGFARKSSTEELVSVDLVAALESAWSLVTMTRSHEVVSIARNFPGDPVRVVAQDQRLQQVLVNLFTNAMDAMKNSPCRVIDLTLGQTGEAVSLAVHDSGHGLAEADMAKIFEPFHTTKPEGEGLGLGLSIAYTIIQDFGGTITAANHPAGGTVFTLTLKKA